MQSYQRFQCIGHTDFNTFGTNGPRSLSQTKVGTHSALREKSHARAHTAKHRAFWTGVLSLPLIRAARSRTSPGRVSERRTLPLLGLGLVCSRRTQKAFGTAMRLCVSLSRRRRGPAGLRDPIAVSLAALMGFAVLLSRFVGTQKIERLFFSYSGAFFEPLFASIHARNLSFGTTIRLPILSAGNSLPCTNS